MRASDWCPYSAVGRVHSLRAWRCQLGLLGWRRRRGRCWSCGVSWWLGLFYQPSRCHTVVPPCRVFYDLLSPHGHMCLCPVALSCSRCDVVNPTLQIRCIGRRSAVALSSPMRPITADAPVSDVRHQHQSDTRSQLAPHFHVMWNAFVNKEALSHQPRRVSLVVHNAGQKLVWQPRLAADVLTNWRQPLLLLHLEHVTGCRQSWNCCDRRTRFVLIWKHFCFILSTVTRIRIDSVMMRLLCLLVGMQYKCLSYRYSNDSIVILWNANDNDRLLLYRLCIMQVNSGMQIMNGQPQQSYPPPPNQPYSSNAPFVAPGQRPPAPYQLPSANFPPVSGNVEDTFFTHVAIHCRIQVLNPLQFPFCDKSVISEYLFILYFADVCMSTMLIVVKICFIFVDGYR